MNRYELELQMITDDIHFLEENGLTDTEDYYNLTQKRESILELCLNECELPEE